jgi:type IV pilus assembly protein PilV
MIIPWSLKAQGNTLIEVMVTILVVSVGLLGMASLQLKSIALNHDSAIRLDAVNLAYDVSDRLFVNALAASAGEYTIALGAIETTPANVDTVAEEDLNRWLRTANLFNGDFSITSMAAAGTEPAFYEIRICWADKFKAGVQAQCDNDYKYQAVRKN